MSHSQARKPGYQSLFGAHGEFHEDGKSWADKDKGYIIFHYSADTLAAPVFQFYPTRQIADLRSALRLQFRPADPD